MAEKTIPMAVPAGPETEAQKQKLAELRELQQRSLKTGGKPAEKKVDPGPEPKVPGELGQLLGKATTSADGWKDRWGEEHQYAPLSFMDLVDFQTHHGDIAQAFQNSADQTGVMLTLVWLSIRYEGCTEEDIDKGAVKYKRARVGRMFGMLDGEALATIAMRVLKLSGLNMDVDEGNAVAAEGNEASPPAKD